MLDKMKANILFQLLLKRPNIEKAYAIVGPEDSWYDTITKVHNSLAEIQKLPHEHWEITSHDGLKLKGIYYPGESDKTVIWVHGYTSHAERESAFPGLFYRSLGFNVLIPYLRAHGPSQGKYITFGALETEDMLRWVGKVNQLHPDGQIVLHGLSMGGGIVLNLSNQEMKNVKCLIADAPNTSILGFFHDVTYGTFKKDKGKEKIYECALERFHKEFSVDAADFETLERVKLCRYPLLLSAGSNENLEERLAAIQANNPENTEVLILPGCNHGNGMYKQTEMFQTAIRKFIDKTMTR